MARISIANALAGIRNAVGAGGQLRAKDQLSAVVDALLQLVGNANIAPGNTEPADPLNSPFTIYVNPYIGTDRFVGGSYNWFEEPAGASDAAKIQAKLKRLENQRLTCGYSKQRPFRTINRVAIEIILATSKSYFTLNSEDAQVDCPAVEFSPGTHIFYNDPGNSPSAIPITEWPAAGFEPTPNHLIAFNPNSGGVVLPRYATASAPLSLRQCTVRPSWVPAAADETADYSNRAAILKITNTSYVYGLTFRDQLGASSSHHLLDCVQAASQADLDQLYAKVRTAMGGASNSGNISNALAVTRLSEYEIVGPFGANPSEASDTVKGASPYVYNCTKRTEWGLGGVHWNGARLAGLKSIVIAQFTGISLQRDLSCWQIYREGAWRAPVSYQELIDSEADDVRMKPQRMSRHITLTNDAFGQMVSVFAIGEGRQHLADSGAQLEFSNSTSNFGGCVAVAKGYASSAFPLDQNWNLRRLKVARSVADQTGNVRQIGLGNVAAISGSLITLELPLAASDDPAIPAVLAAQGYSLPAGTLIWIENQAGPDWRATLAANAWVSTSATEIDITGAALEAGTNLPIGTGSGGASLAIGRKVYIRRLWDNRSSAQRRVSLRLANTTNSRVPVRNSILQTRPGVTGGGIDRVLAPGGAEVLAVTTTAKIPAEGAGVVMSAEITIRRSSPDEVYAANRFYRKGQTVKHADKHFTAMDTHVSVGSTPDEARWQESYVQQASDYNAEDPTTLEAPQLIFDTDTDGDTELTTTCGINWATIYTSAGSSGSVRDQLRSATDYRGALALLLALGFSSTAAHNALVPRTEASRELDPASATDFPTPPSGGAASGRANWALEFRQPSFIQLLGQNLNGVGFWNYTRALPRWRRTMSARNEFNANFAPEQGGRVEIKGINKDGFEVTNQGLINTDTGEAIGVDDVGRDGDIPPPTRLDNLTVDNLTVTGKLDVNGVSELDGGDAMGMTTSKYGFGQLAPITDYLNSTVGASTDEQLSQANTKIVTLPGLIRWRIEQRLLSQRTGVQTVYVDPVNGANTTDLNTLLTTPPTSSENRIKSLAAAANYANAAFSPQEIVEYRLGPGIYPEYGALTFKSVTRIRAWSYAGSGAYLNDSLSGGTIPFSSANFYDPTKQPIFLSRITSFLLFTSQSVLLATVNPLQLIFEQDAEITGVAWWGSMTTIANTGVPDSFWPGTTATTVGASSATPGNWRNSAIADPDNALNYFIRSHAMLTSPLSGQFYGIRQLPVIEFRNKGLLSNVAFGAMAPAASDFTGNATNLEGLIKISTDQVIGVRGLKLVGNIKISSEVNTGEFTSIRLRGPGDPAESFSLSSYFVNGHSTRLFVPASSSRSVSVVFDTPTPTEVGTLLWSANYNAPYNNVELLNAQAPPAIATAAESPNTANWKDQGPAFEAIFDRFGIFINPEPTRNWNQFRVKTSDGASPAYGTNVIGSAGFNGVFGNYQISNNSLANQRTTGMSILTPSSSASTITGFGLDTNSTIFRVAGTGLTPANATSGLGNGEVGAYVNFDPLNIRVRTVNRGVSTSNGMTAIVTVTL